MKSIAILFFIASTNALGASGGKYVGESDDKYHFSIDTETWVGEPLDASIESQGIFAVRPTIEVTENRRTISTINSCLFFYNPDDHEQDRLECAKDPNSRLSEVVYVRNKKSYRKSHGSIDELICAKGCSKKVPKVFRIKMEEDDC